MKLPSYPVITVDPFFSIWSRSDKLNESDTCLWCGIRKPIKGTVTFDGVTYRFLGAGDEEKLTQVKTEILPYVSEYTFENDKLRLILKTWSPLLLDDFHLLATPVAYFDFEVQNLTGEEKAVSVSIEASEELCYDRKVKETVCYTSNFSGFLYAKMGRTKQNPIYISGDGVSADWGYYLISGGSVSASRHGIKSTHTVNVNKVQRFSTLMAYDDIYSIEYFGEKLKGLWTEKFSSIEEALKFCTDNRADLLKRIKAQNELILKDSKEFGEDYQKILSAAARQVLAAHKLVRNSKGELLYMSKECHSNGCINTVDVSYPALPMYLLYAPELVKAMCTGIFTFANMPLWKADFAPHDIGRYPWANGQVYALAPAHHLPHHRISYRKVYKKKSMNIFMPQFQMPVEECGNMLVMAYSYYKMTGDKAFLKENFELLSKWADFLKNKGIDLDNQLCTDDFAGHSKRNVNLAIKSIMGRACYNRICEALDIADESLFEAKQDAEKLIALCETDGYLPFALSKKDSWSLKYNMVWDIVFGFNIFDEKLYEAETMKYRDELNKYGVPLDSRKDFTKTDWMLWAACLDKTGENVKSFSKTIVDFLAESESKVCFSDWYDTKTAKQCGFDHRTVQAGLWMPVLNAKIQDK